MCQTDTKSNTCNKDFILETDLRNDLSGKTIFFKMEKDQLTIAGEDDGFRAVLGHHHHLDCHVLICAVPHPGTDDQTLVRHGVIVTELPFQPATNKEINLKLSKDEQNILECEIGAQNHHQQQHEIWKTQNDFIVTMERLIDQTRTRKCRIRASKP